MFLRRSAIFPRDSAVSLCRVSRKGAWNEGRRSQNPGRKRARDLSSCIPLQVFNVGAFRTTLAKIELINYSFTSILSCLLIALYTKNERHRVNPALSRRS